MADQPGWVRARGWRTLHVFALVFAILAVPIVVLYVRGFGVASTTTAEGVGFYLLGAGLTLGFFAALSTTRVRVSDDGVTFRTPASSVSVPWEALEPPVRPAVFGEVAFLPGPGAPAVSGGLRVTVEQARAILLHPAHPPWDVATPVLRSLRLPDGGPALGREPPGPAPRS